MEKKPVLVMGCGILKKEAQFLIEKNKWPVETLFFDSSLHVNFDALQKALTGGLEKNADREIVVFYGACHPLMERILGSSSTRVQGQNCIEILLGEERFAEELAAGAFFLMEDWAVHWDQVISKTFGNKPAAIRELFQSEHSFLLCIRTPCSGDFEAAAIEAGRKSGLPLRWMDVSLDYLESALRKALQGKLGEFE